VWEVELDRAGRTNDTGHRRIGQWLDGTREARKRLVAGTARYIIDDRLFEPFNFCSEFELRPIFVNDDMVDVIMSAGRADQRAAAKMGTLAT
jgi:hypothetical protein